MSDAMVVQKTTSQASAPEVELDLGAKPVRGWAPSGDALSGGRIYGHDMPSISDILARQQSAYDVLLTASSKAQRSMNHERRVWLSLVVLALIWGIMTGLTMAVESFWLDPYTAVFGCLATGVLAATTRTHGRRR